MKRWHLESILKCHRAPGDAVAVIGLLLILVAAVSPFLAWWLP